MILARAGYKRLSDFSFSLLQVQYIIFYVIIIAINQLDHQSILTPFPKFLAQLHAVYMTNAYIKHIPRPYITPEKNIRSIRDASGTKRTFPPLLSPAPGHKYVYEV